MRRVWDGTGMSRAFAPKIEVSIPRRLGWTQALLHLTTSACRRFRSPVGVFQSLAQPTPFHGRAWIPIGISLIAIRGNRGGTTLSLVMSFAGPRFGSSKTTHFAERWIFPT